MVINESPDGYALMHIHGPKDAISVNNLVAIELPSGNNLPAPNPAIAIIRWVLSENPEHLEIGLQVLATQGFAVNVVLTGETPARTAQGIWLKRQPPLLTKDLLALPSDHQIQHQARCTLSNAEIGSEPQDWQIAGTREDNGVTSLYTLSPVGTG